MIARIEFVDAVFLLDDFRTVHSQPGFARQNDIARQPCSQRQAAKTADRAGSEADHRGMLSQCQDGGHDLGGGGQAQVGLLQADAACLKQNDRAGRDSLQVVRTGQIEGGRHFFAGHLSDAASLKCALERHHHCCLSRDLSLHHHTAIVRLWGDTLHRKPGRLHAIEWADQLARCSRIEERRGPLPRVELNEALPVDETRIVSLAAHRSLASTACSRRSITLPGVAPASLI